MLLVLFIRRTFETERRSNDLSITCDDASYLGELDNDRFDIHYTLLSYFLLSLHSFHDCVSWLYYKDDADAVEYEEAVIFVE